MIINILICQLEEITISGCFSETCHRINELTNLSHFLPHGKSVQENLHKKAILKSNLKYNAVLFFYFSFIVENFQEEKRRKRECAFKSRYGLLSLIVQQTLTPVMAVPHKETIYGASFRTVS